MAIRRPKNPGIKIPLIRISGFSGLMTRSFKICLDNFKLIVIYSLIFELPQNLLDNFSHHFLSGWAGVAKIVMDVSIFILELIFYSVGFPAFVYAIVHVIKNKGNPPFRKALNFGLGNGLRFLGWNLL